MSQLAIETNHLTKCFSDVVVDNISLRVETGTVYGFVGPNGAGKTTTIRMILGLIKPSKGAINILGHNIINEQNHIAGKVGAMIESPTFYPTLSGWTNLELLCKYNGRKPQRGELEKLLNLVGLSRDARREVCQYSLGMKQRLGLASVLLGEPDLLVLDEPCNGLDPDGIQEVRELIKHLTSEQGKTVFLTSHTLNEVEEVSDVIGVIASGKLIRQEKLSQLLTASVRYILKCQPIEKAFLLLNNLNFISTVYSTRQADCIEVEICEEKVPELLIHLVKNEIRVFQVKSKSKSLEEVFFESIRTSTIVKSD